MSEFETSRTLAKPNMTEQPFPPTFPFDLLKRFLDPELVRVMGAIQSITNYEIPQDRQEPFHHFHSFITDPQPTYITAWRESEKHQKWYRAHVDGILTNVRGGLTAAHYHLDRLAELERQVEAILKDSDFASRMGSSVSGLGGTIKLDIEYQAFVLSCRRSLDYLAGALAAYFKMPLSSFRTLPKALRRGKPEAVLAAICEAHARHAHDLDFILATEGKKSTRDRIAHFEFVSAGCVNLRASGFGLVGGGEEIFPQKSQERTRLADLLSQRLNRLHECIADMIESFVAAAASVEHEPHRQG